MNEHSLRITTQWIYENRHTGYWTFPILLSNNVSQKVKDLKLSADDASAVFDVLSDLELLKQIDEEKKIMMVTNALGTE